MTAPISPSYFPRDHEGLAALLDPDPARKGLTEGDMVLRWPETGARLELIADGPLIQLAGIRIEPEGIVLISANDTHCYRDRHPARIRYTDAAGMTDEWDTSAQPINYGRGAETHYDFLESGTTGQASTMPPPAPAPAPAPEAPAPAPASATALAYGVPYRLPTGETLTVHAPAGALP